jgi:hypothetical protein
MNVVGGWVVAPVILLLLVSGVGLLVEQLAGRPLVGMLVPAVGLAGLVVVAGWLTILDATAEWAPAASAVLALAGFVSSPRWRRRPALRSIGVAAALAIATFGVFAAPTLSTGHATLAGYIKLDDSANWLGLTAHVMDHGIGTIDRAPSTYDLVLDAWLGGGYPVGSLTPLGVASKLARVDPADAYQATIAAYAAIAAMALAACAQEIVRSRARAGAAGFIAAQASTFFGYTQWGGIKEAAVLPILVALGAGVAHAWHARSNLRAQLPLVLAAGALLDILGVPGATWVAPALVLSAVGAAVTARFRGSSRRPWKAAVRLGGAGGIVSLALAAVALPAIVALDFARNTTGVLSDADELGNLVRPLAMLQGAGLWPARDFRVDPSSLALNLAIAVAVLAAAAAATMLALIDRRLMSPAYVSVTAVGAVPALVVGSPWVDAKVLALTAPAALLPAAALALASLRGTTRRVVVAGALATLGLVGVTAWSTVTASRDVWVAPRDGFDELRAIAARVRGQGPLLVLDHDTFASRYFLRDSDAEGATDLRVHAVLSRSGSTFPDFSTVEVDDVDLDELFAYRTLVRRASPVASRPPGAYRRVYEGRVWEAWQRDPDAARPLQHVALGQPLDPTGSFDCGTLPALLQGPPGLRVRAVPRAAPTVVELGDAAPASWRTAGGIVPDRDGTMLVSVRAPTAGEYRVWIGGSVFGRLRVVVNGHKLGSYRHELAHGAPWLRFGAVALPAGPQLVEIRYERGVLAAGSGSAPSPIGPLALSRTDDDDLEVVVRPGQRADELCGDARYDWVEVLR